MAHWKASKRVLRCLHWTKNYMLEYRKSKEFDIIEYFDSDSDFAGCIDSKNYFRLYLFASSRSYLMEK